MNNFYLKNDFYLHSDWQKFLDPLFNQQNWFDIKNFLLTQKQKGKIIYPPFDKIFYALNLCPLKKIKIVIIGQDPYHGENQANGLAFSVTQNIKIPPSLKNIFQEIKRDIDPDYKIKTGDLSHWGKQGVLLLNSCLSVEKNKPASHNKIGWQSLSNNIIQKINNELDNIVFLLWGNYAKQKLPLLNTQKHLVLTSAHPSPFSVKNFAGNQHFSKANQYLLSHKLPPINWLI